MAQKKAAKKTKKTTRQGALKRMAKTTRKPAKKARRVSAPHSKSVPELLQGKPEPVKKLARGANVPAGTTVEELGGNVTGGYSTR